MSEEGGSMAEQTCRCGHEKEDHRRGYAKCLCGISVDGVDVECECEDYEPAAQPEADQCTCPKPDYFCGEPQDSTCTLSEEQHEELWQAEAAPAQVAREAIKTAEREMMADRLKGRDRKIPEEWGIPMLNENEPASSSAPQIVTTTEHPPRIPSSHCLLEQHDYCSGCGCACHDVGARPVSSAPQIPAPGWLQRTAERIRAEVNESPMTAWILDTDFKTLVPAPPTTPKREAALLASLGDGDTHCVATDRAVVFALRDQGKITVPGECYDGGTIVRKTIR